MTRSKKSNKKARNRSTSQVFRIRNTAPAPSSNESTPAEQEMPSQSPPHPADLPPGTPTGPRRSTQDRNSLERRREEEYWRGGEERYRPGPPPVLSPPRYRDHRRSLSPPPDYTSRRHEGRNRSRERARWTKKEANYRPDYRDYRVRSRSRTRSRSPLPRRGSGKISAANLASVQAPKASATVHKTSITHISPTEARTQGRELVLPHASSTSNEHTRLNPEEESLKSTTASVLSINKTSATEAEIPGRETFFFDPQKPAYKETSITKVQAQKPVVATPDTSATRTKPPIVGDKAQASKSSIDLGSGNTTTTVEAKVQGTIVRPPAEVAGTGSSAATEKPKYFMNCFETPGLKVNTTVQNINRSISPSKISIKENSPTKNRDPSLSHSPVITAASIVNNEETGSMAMEISKSPELHANADLDSIMTAASLGNADLEEALGEKASILLDQVAELARLKQQEATAKHTKQRREAEFEKTKEHHEKFPVSKETTTLAVKTATKEYREISSLRSKEQTSLNALGKEFVSALLLHVYANNNFNTSIHNNKKIASLQKTCDGFDKLVEGQKKFQTEFLEQQRKQHEELEKRWSDKYGELENQHLAYVQIQEKEVSALKKVLGDLKDQNETDKNLVLKEVKTVQTNFTSIKNELQDVQAKKSSVTQTDGHVAKINNRLASLESSQTHNSTELSGVEGRLSQVESSVSSKLTEASNLKQQTDKIRSDCAKNAVNLVNHIKLHEDLATKMSQAEVTTKALITDIVNRSREAEGRLDKFEEDKKTEHIPTAPSLPAANVVTPSPVPLDLEQRLREAEICTGEVKFQMAGLPYEVGGIINRSVAAKASSLQQQQKTDADSLRASIATLKTDQENLRKETTASQNQLLQAATTNATSNAMNAMGAAFVTAETHRTTIAALQGDIDACTHSLGDAKARLDNIHTGHLHAAITSTVKEQIMDDMPNYRALENRMAGVQNALASVKVLEEKVLALEETARTGGSADLEHRVQGMRTELDVFVQDVANNAKSQKETAESLAGLHEVVARDQLTSVEHFEKLSELEMQVEGLRTLYSDGTIARVAELESQVEELKKIDGTALESNIVKLDSEVQKLKKSSDTTELASKVATLESGLSALRNGEDPVLRSQFVALETRIKKLDNNVRVGELETKVDKLEKSTADRALPDRATMTPVPGPSRPASSAGRTNSPAMLSSTRAPPPPKAGAVSMTTGRSLTENKKRPHAQTNGTTNSKTTTPKIANGTTNSKNMLGKTTNGRPSGSPVSKRRKKNTSREDDPEINDSHSDERTREPSLPDVKPLAQHLANGAPGTPGLTEKAVDSVFIDLCDSD